MAEESSIKPFTKNKDTNLVLTAAERKGWKTEVILDTENTLAEISKGTLKYRVMRGTFSVNSSVSIAISTNKFFTNEVLKKVTTFVPDSHLLPVTGYDLAFLQTYLTQYKKVVAKAVDQNNGIGVFTGLTDLPAVEAAIASIAQLGSKQFLLENHVETTKEYRIIVWKGEVIDIVERIPGHVVGNGTDTIEALINAKNADGKVRFRELVYPGIEIDALLKEYLAQTSRSLTDVPKQDEHVQLRFMCNMMQGGETKRIPVERMHPMYVEIFRKVYESTWMNYYGADLITDNIENEPKVGVTAINELNGSPGLSAPLFADVQEGRMFYNVDRILEKMESNPVVGFSA